MNNPNEHIEDFLEYYFKLKKPPHYAVLLKGKWGVGKTWFLKNVIRQLDSPNDKVKRYLYVSLYGIASFEEIENDFFRQLHPVLSSKKMALAGKIGKGILKTTLKIDLDGDGKSDANVTSQIPDINLPNYLSNTEGLTLVFDDLERASMDLESLLGYINYFVEHQGYKVIVIANEEEIFSIEEKTKISYRRIKEKLIGKTFEIQPRLDLAIENFIKEIENRNTQNFFESNLDLIKDYYQRSNYWNLRHLRQALMDFARLLDLISNKIKEKNEIVSHLFTIYLVLSFEIKSGGMLSTDINKIDSLYFVELASKSNGNTDKLENIDKFYLEIKEKYPMFNPMDMLLENSVWIDIFDKGLIDKEEINKSLENSHFFQNENQSDWVKLWHYTSLEDHDFDSVLAKVKAQFSKNEFEEVGEIKHITGLFFQLIDENLLSMTKVQVLENAISNIENLIDKGRTIPSSNSFFDDVETFGLGFHNKNDSKFKEFEEYLSDRAVKQIEDSLPKLGRKLLEDVKNEPENFFKKVVYNGSSDIYQKYPVLKYIAPKDLVSTLINIKPYNRKYIVMGISSRYKNSDSIGVLLSELAWLQEVVYLLREEAKLRKGKVTGLQIIKFTDYYLVTAINFLHQNNPNIREAKNYKWFKNDKNHSYLNIILFLS